MASVTGTATDAQDLFSKLQTFLKTNATLVGLGEDWTEAWAAGGGDPFPDDVVLQGPGVSGTDEILIGLRLEETAPGDSWRLNIVGMTGVIVSATEYDQHVNVSPAVGLLLDINPMTYWFTASGRRFIVVVKIATVFECAYAGFILPYGNPVEYPYPVFVGGTCNVDQDEPILTWRSTTDAHAAFPFADYDLPTLGLSSFEPGAYMLDPAGEWHNAVGMSGRGDRDTVIAPRNYGADQDPDEAFAVRADFSIAGDLNIGYETIRYNMGKAYGGAYALTPFTIIQTTPQSQTYGVLDGVLNCPGEGNSSENIVTISAVDYLVVQNIFRTGLGEYMTVKLA
jgi:hypothetical protein